MDWKTTLTGFVTAAALLLSHYNILIPSGVQTEVIALGVAIIGWVSKDSKSAEGLK